MPPDDATRYELARDATLAFLARKEFTAFAVLLIPFVLGFGGLWFFLLIGLHTLEEEQAHFWQNVAIQILTVCMAYAAAVSLPYRAANALHLCCSHRSSTVGLDFYGRPTQDIWFHLPRGHRGAITALLLGNCGAQFVNRGARCVYPTYESSHRMPGFFWTTGFLLFAFLLQGVAAAYTAVLQGGLRKAHPGRFAPSPLERIVNTTGHTATACGALEGSGLGLSREWAERLSRCDLEKRQVLAVQRLLPGGSVFLGMTILSH